MSAIVRPRFFLVVRMCCARRPTCREPMRMAESRCFRSKRQTENRPAGRILWPLTCRAGHLVYVHQGTLHAVPFDLDRMEVHGVQVPLLDDVAGDRCLILDSVDSLRWRSGAVPVARKQGSDSTVFVHSRWQAPRVRQDDPKTGAELWTPAAGFKRSRAA